MTYANMEAEQAVLGALLAHNEAILQCGDLKEGHFHHPAHAALFRNVLGGWQAGVVVTPVTLKRQFSGVEGFDSTYLAKLVASAGGVVHIGEYARLIVEAAVRRELEAAARAVLESPPEASNADLVTQLAGAVDSATKHQLSAKLHTGAEVRDALVERMKANPRVYSTGLKRIDAAMEGGFHEGRLYGIAADSGHGKTLLACTVSNHLKNAGVKHLFICAEMGEEETHSRSLAMDSDIDVRAFSDKHKRDADFWGKMGDIPLSSDRNVIYYSDPFLTFESLKRVIAVAVMRHKVSGFILDYWQLVGGKPSRDSEANFLGEVAQWQAAACKQYKIFGLNTAQLNRDGVVLGSGGLQRAVDQMYFLHRPDPTEPTAWLEMRKSRYTRFMHIGSENDPSLAINERGGYFEEIPQTSANYSVMSKPVTGKNYLNTF